LVIAMMYELVKQGGPTYWDRAASLFGWGFALNPQASIGSL
jgi:D-alanyl-D-alanine carboxypeptidase (penicillin-binding protein 5/6)